MSTPTSEKTNRSMKVDLVHNPTFRKYELSASGEIFAYLKALAGKSRMVTVYGSSGEEFFLSTVLGLDSERNLVFIERARYELEWLKEPPEAFLCDTDIDRIQIQFELKNIEQTEFQGGPAWSAIIPESVIRLQRREFFRLSIPIAQPVYCRIPGFPTKSEETRFVLSDISGSGMGFSAPIELAPGLTPGTEYTDCELSLPNHPSFPLGIIVRNAYEVTSRNGIRTLRVGAEFTHLTPARVNQIQRYITTMERERRAHAAG